jgi:hypothetical protein
MTGAAPSEPPLGPPSNVPPDPFRPEPVDPKTLPRILRPGYRAFLWAMATRKRRRFYYNFTRAALVIGMIILVTFSILPELTGTGLAATDPLTRSGPIVIPPDNITGFSGLVEGEDVILGNFTVMSPTNATVEFFIVPAGNASWTTLVDQLASQEGSYTTGAPVHAGNYQWSAILTLTYDFLFLNPSSTQSVTVYSNSQYVSSEPPA